MHENKILEDFKAIVNPAMDRIDALMTEHDRLKAIIAKHDLDEPELFNNQKQKEFKIKIKNFLQRLISNSITDKTGFPIRFNKETLKEIEILIKECE